jgi:hypothetical protein
MRVAVSKPTKPIMDKVVNIVMDLYYRLILFGGESRATKQRLLSRKFLAAVITSRSRVSLSG